ncbi:MAG: DUF3343 domain-containing protein [Gordonibacter sp.]|uniref:DUF3343 domain-containing protein n=1 Tax=Gordonibacter sp. TaxID=1968902 RepID=UPI00321FD015
MSERPASSVERSTGAAPELHVYVVAFESTHAAMAAASVLEARGARMIPTPRAISASCGMSLRFDAPSDGAARAFAADVPDVRGLAALYAQEGEGYRLVAQL